MRSEARSHRPSEPSARGFALIVVVLIVALLSLVAATLLNLIKLDLTVVGQNRKNNEARVVAEGSLMEIIDDNRVASQSGTAASLLPDFSTPGSRRVLVDPTNMFGTGQLGTYAQRGGPNLPCAPAPPSPHEDPCFIWQANNPEGLPSRDYSADVRFIREGPFPESGTQVHAVVYEIRSIGNVNNGESTSEVRAEVWNVRPVDTRLLPRRHAR